MVLSATPFETAPLRDELQPHATVDMGQPGQREVEGMVHPDHAGPLDPHRLVHGSLRGVPVALAVSGIGKANAAAAAASVIAGPARPLQCILQVGIGGAYPGSGLATGDVVLAHSEFDLDLGVRSSTEWRGLESLGFAAFGHDGEPNRLSLEGDLLAAVRSATGLRSAAFATSDSVTSGAAAAAAIAQRHGVAVESMEGVAAAQVAAAHRVPFLELRAISNVVGDRDKTRWAVAEAIAAATAAALDVMTVIWAYTAGATKEAR